MPRRPAEHAADRALAALAAWMAGSLAGGMAGGMAGCAGAPGIADPSEAPAGERVVALHADRQLTVERLGPALLDRAGAEVLAALVLDHELRSRTSRPEPSDLEAERASLNARQIEPGTIEEAVLTGPRAADRAARLRQIAAEIASVDDAEIDLAERIRSGPRYRVRVLVLPSPGAASDLRDRLLGQNASSTVEEREVIDAALRESIDAGAAVGGLIRALSPLDPGVPAVIREATGGLQPGQLSDVLAIDRRGALVWMGGATTPPASVDAGPDPRTRDAIADELRRRKQDRLIPELAARLLRDARVDVLAPEMARRWAELVRTADP